MCSHTRQYSRNLFTMSHDRVGVQNVPKKEILYQVIFSQVIVNHSLSTTP